MQEDGADAEGVLRAPHDPRLMRRSEASRAGAAAGQPRDRVPRRRALLTLSGLVSLAAAGSGAGRGWAAPPDAVQTDEIGDQIQRLPHMPCFCGCGRLRHRDNRHAKYGRYGPSTPTPAPPA
jgi:hypothetical protein